MRKEKLFCADVWGWSPVELREMFISERKALIQDKINAEQDRQLKLLEKSMGTG